MSESKTYYSRGLKNFKKGNLEKAIGNLDIAISYSMNNSEALNLRAQVYYLKGNKEKALSNWKINVDFNNDEMAKKSIKNFEKDLLNEERFKKGMYYLNNLQVKRAIDFFELATGTDFNIINTRNMLTACYRKEKNYESARKNALLVLKIDKNNEVAKDHLRFINSKKNSRWKKVAIFILVVLGVVSLSKFTKKMDKENLMSLKETTVTSDSIESDETLNDISKEKPKENEKELVLPTLSLDLVSDAIRKKDYLWVDDNIDYINDIEENHENKEVLNQVSKMMKYDGLEYFYDKGREHFKDKKFESAKDMFVRALNYSKGTYLDEHILYMLGVSYENLKDIENTIKYLDGYVNLENIIEDGSYIQEVLYKLALITENLNIIDSKNYANILVNNFHDSMYNNNKIKAILNK